MSLVCGNHNLEMRKRFAPVLLKGREFRCIDEGAHYVVQIMEPNGTWHTIFIEPKKDQK